MIELCGFNFEFKSVHQVFNCQGRRRVFNCSLTFTDLILVFNLGVEDVF